MTKIGVDTVKVVYYSLDKFYHGTSSLTPIQDKVFPPNPKLIVKVDGCDVWYDSEALIYEKLENNTFDNITSRREV